MERRTLASPGLASSLTSSSDGRQRLILIVDRRQRIRGAEALIKGIIWKFFGFHGVRSSARGSDCQQGADSEKLRIPRELPDFQTFHGTTHILHAAERETSPSCGRASGIGRLRPLCRIVPRSQDGCSSRHICFPISVEAYSVSWSMIFVYSRVFNAFHSCCGNPLNLNGVHMIP